MGEAYINGIGFHKFGRFPDKTLKMLAADASLAAIDDAGLGIGDIDAVFCANAYAGLLNGQESVRGETWMRGIGIGGVPIFNVENACAGGSTAVHLATIAVRAGTYRRVLVVGAEKMFSGDTAKAIAALANSSDTEMTSGIGMQFAAVDAMRVKKVMREESLGQSALNWVTAKNHDNGSLNPIAQYRDPMSEEEVANSRMIAEPVRLFMCSAISDGAAACIISDQPARRSVRIAASALATSPIRARMPGASTATLAVKRAYDEAGVSPADIDFAEMHDAVSPLEFIYYRDLGFCEAGKVAQFVEQRGSALNGRFPVNPSGGINARGHPVAATGVAQIGELVLQLSSDAGSRQLVRARRGLAHNAGGWIGDDPAVNTIHILEAAR